jgi:hypothetical protein
MGGKPEWWPDRIEPQVLWVRFEAKRSVEFRQRLAVCAGMAHIAAIQHVSTFKYRITDASPVLEMVRLLEAQPAVMYALPNPVGPWPNSGDAPGRLVPNAMVIKFRNGAIQTDEWIKDFEQDHGLIYHSHSSIGWYSFDVVDGSSLLDKVAELSTNPDIENVLPNLYGEWAS